MAPPFHPESVPTDAELRVAQAQLVGWLEGLFHGIQATIYGPADGSAGAARGRPPAGAADRPVGGHEP